MLAEKRFAEILNLVEERRTITVQELTALLNTSESTIRRDLNTLHDMGKLRKVFGGATALEDNSISTRDDIVPLRQTRHPEEKSRIVRYAAPKIYDGDFVYLDAGTTTALLIEHIPPVNAIFVTNAVFHARALAQRGLKVYLLGGEFKPVTEAVIGPKAIESLSGYNFTKGFFGTNAISLSAGFSTPDVEEAMVKSKAMKQCKDRYSLADPSKFGLRSAATFAPGSSAQSSTTKANPPDFYGKPNIEEVDAL